jgi:murein DD-endopeptidase MepM/ murein hydrolase activator NlpD
MTTATAALIAAAWLFVARGAAAFEPDVFTTEPAEPRQGDIVRITAGMPPHAQGGSVTFEGRTFGGFVSGGLLNAYVGVDLDSKPGAYPLVLDYGVERAARQIAIRARAFAVERLSVDSKYTDLDEATERRVAREQAELDALWSTISPQRLWTNSFVRPVAGALGSPFGLRRFFNGEARSPHAGLDLKAPTGAEVLAANSGRVALARDLFFTGHTVVIDHGLGLFTIYAHLSRIDVGAGNRVERSQRVGLVGATGRATGPHLHWGVKLGGARVDPATLPGVAF